MKVSELMTKDVRTCRPFESMQRAARIMWERDCGCVPIVDEDRRVVGVLTDRDVTMAALTKGLPLTAMPIEQAMSRGAACCRESDDVESALRLMAELQLHRLPVVGADDKLRGLVSMADIVQETARQKLDVQRKLMQQVLSTLASVTKPRKAFAAEPIREIVPATATSAVHV